ncbi:hypothetical protein YC2023_069423 [Brassica napus]
MASQATRLNPPSPERELVTEGFSNYLAKSASLSATKLFIGRTPVIDLGIVQNICDGKIQYFLLSINFFNTLSIKFHIHLD